MHLSRLTTAEMIELSQCYFEPGHPAAEALAEKPELVSLMTRLREVHQFLSASLSADDLRASSLQKEITALEQERTLLARGIDHLCQGLALLSEPEELAARWKRMHRLLLPGGDAPAAALSPQIAAENAALLEQIFEGLNGQDKGLFKNHYVGKRPLFEIVMRWIAAGKELGQKELERQSVPVTPTDGALQEARNQWTRTVGAIASMLSMSELLGELPAALKDHVLTRLRAATDRKPGQGPAVETSSGAAPESSAQADRAE